MVFSRISRISFLGYHLTEEVAVGLARGEFALPTVCLEEFRRVCQIEVAREEKRMLQFARLMDEGMAEGGVVLPERRIAEVAEEDAPATSAPLPDGGEKVDEGRRRSRLVEPVGRFAWLWVGA